MTSAWATAASSAFIFLACLQAYNVGRAKGGGPLYNNAVATGVLLASLALLAWVVMS